MNSRIFDTFYGVMYSVIAIIFVVMVVSLFPHKEPNQVTCENKRYTITLRQYKQESNAEFVNRVNILCYGK